MPNPYSTELRARAVGAYEAGDETCEQIATRFEVGVLDQSGANLAMGRSHAWLPRGTELIEPRPMNWAENLTMVGAMRIDGWLTLATGWQAARSPASASSAQPRSRPRTPPANSAP